jgi:multidrug efflux pump subunit AcrA (membrane-fusion protein)
MFANVRVLAGSPGQALLIPDVAVQSDQGYKYVYLASGENKVESRYIETGRAHGPLREVLKGLTPADRVIVNGLIMLRPGAKVEVQEAGAEPEGARTATGGQSKPQT